MVYAELLFTIFAFLTMTALSYLISNRIIHSHIKTNAENELTLAQERLESEFIRARMVLNIFSETSGGMVAQGASLNQLQENIRHISGSIEITGGFSRFKNFICY
jgi:hypothetical protein